MVSFQNTDYSTKAELDQLLNLYIPDDIQYFYDQCEHPITLQIKLPDPPDITSVVIHKRIMIKLEPVAPTIPLVTLNKFMKQHRNLHEKEVREAITETFNDSLTKREMDTLSIFLNQITLNTQSDYYAHLRRIWQFAASNCFIPKTICIERLILLPNINDIMRAYFYFCAERESKVSRSELLKCVSSINWGRKWLGFDPLPPNNHLKQMVTAISKEFCLKPVGRQAIPQKLLVHLFCFLYQHYFDYAEILLLMFWHGSRPSETLKLQKKHIDFKTTYEHKKYIKITYVKTKTRKKYANDSLEIIVYPQKDRYFCCPYAIVERLVNRCSTPEAFLAPWKNQRTTKTNHFPAWFTKMKFEFQNWIFQQKGWTPDVSKWTPSVMRTSFVGIMKAEGFDWDIICSHTGHTPGSTVKQKVYLTNAVSTAGFQPHFAQKIRKNKKLKTLMTGFNNLQHGIWDERSQPSSRETTLDGTHVFQQQSISDTLPDEDLYATPEPSTTPDGGYDDSSSTSMSSRQSTPNMGFYAMYRKRNAPY